MDEDGEDCWGLRAFRQANKFADSMNVCRVGRDLIKKLNG